MLLSVGGRNSTQFPLALPMLYFGATGLNVKIRKYYLPTLQVIMESEHTCWGSGREGAWDLVHL